MKVLEARAWARDLREELCARNRMWAQGRLHVESHGDPPVVVYAPDHPTDQDLLVGTLRDHLSGEGVSPGTFPKKHLSEDLKIASERHGNFFEPAYQAILA